MKKNIFLLILALLCSCQKPLQDDCIKPSFSLGLMVIGDGDTNGRPAYRDCYKIFRDTSLENWLNYYYE